MKLQNLLFCLLALVLYILLLDLLPLLYKTIYYKVQ